MDEQHKKHAYQLANIGHWEFDVVNGQLFWSDQVKHLHEVPLDYEPDLESALAFYEEGTSRDNVQRAVNEAIEEGTSFSLESIITTANGNTRWVKAVGEPVVKNGRCVRIYGSTQDITDRKILEKQLQQERDRISEAEQEKARILKRIDDGFFAVDENWIVKYWNKEAEQILGVSQNHIIGRNLWEVFEEATELDFYDQYHKALEQQVTVHFEEFYHPQDMWITVSAYPSEAGLSVYFRDITQRKQTEKELQEKEAQLRNIANNIDGMVLRYQLHSDGTDDFVFVSDGVEDLHELSPQQVMGSSDMLWSQVVDNHVDMVRQSVKQSAEQLTPWSQKWKIETPSGQQKWIHGRGTPQKLGDGTIQWDTILLDVTDQKELEQNISRQVSLLNNILDSIPGLFYMVRDDLSFARTNKNVEQLFALTPKELQEINALTLVVPRERSKAKKIIGKAFQEGYAELETVLIGGDDREHHYYMNGSRITLDGKHYVIGSGIDITDRIKAEQENSVLLQEVHHRVKNNLAIISGILTLELDELSFDSRNRLPIERSVNRIQAIAKVHELLYQSSSFSQVDVSEYISNLANTVTSTLQAGEEVDIRLDIAEVKMNINEIIPLGMLLNELLTNSLKYAFQNHQQGLITLDVTQHQQSYKVKYRDNGRGFDRSDFEDSATLGFTIVNLLLQQLQANYEIETESGFEITFSFDKQATGSHANL